MQLDIAERSLTNLLARASECADAHRLMGIAAQMRGDYTKAANCLRQALIHRPDDATIHMNFGSALYETGAIDEALSNLQRACELAPATSAAWYNLGKALKLQGRMEEACRSLQRALHLDAAHVLARISLADAQTTTGHIAAATANYREVLHRQPDNATAWFALANLKTVTMNATDVQRLQQIFRQPAVSDDARISIGFALAKALADQNDHAGSFETLREANALKRRMVDWNADAARAHVDAIISAFARPMPKPLDETLGHEVIFIVSLPRSASTLTEQILATHPQVEGANEITDLPQVIEDESKRRGQPFPQWASSATAEDWQRLGRDYLARTERWRAQRPCFTDKNLVSWELVGAALQMLPGARIVHSRRDALETCFACYRQLFSNGAHFSYDLDDMASYYEDHDRLMRFWHQMFPTRIFDHVHESLLADPESQIRRLLDFCALEFDPACLLFHQNSRVVLSTASAAQVRQPLRSNTSQTARYGDKLDRLRARLRDAGLSA